MTKVISLSEEAYARLKAMKLKDESFSDVVKRLCTREGSLLDIVDLYPDLQDLDEFQQAISSNERATKERLGQLEHELS